MLALECVLDSQTLVEWLNGQWSVLCYAHRLNVARILYVLQSMWRAGLWRPRHSFAPFARHVYREHNKMADELATAGLKRLALGYAFPLPDVKALRGIRVLSDGGRRTVSQVDFNPNDVKISGGGWVLWVALDLTSPLWARHFETLCAQVSRVQECFDNPLRARREGLVGWVALACSSFHLGWCTVMQAEARACLQGVYAACSLVNEGRLFLRPSGFLDQF